MTVRWLKDSEILFESTPQEPFSLSSEDSKVFLHANYSITIYNISREDIGDFICTIDTGVGDPISVSHAIALSSIDTEKDGKMVMLAYIKLIVAVVMTFLVLCILCIIFPKILSKRSEDKCKIRRMCCCVGRATYNMNSQNNRDYLKNCFEKCWRKQIAPSSSQSDAKVNFCFLINWLNHIMLIRNEKM